jgi:uncharacterized membrane protein
MVPLQFGIELLNVLFWLLVPLAILVIVVYRLAQIAVNTERIADALEELARKQD